MNKKIVFAIIAVLFFSGCDVISSNQEETFDSGLTGVWKLESQTIVTSGGTVLHPFSEHILTIDDNGTFMEDYAVETVPDVVVDNPVMPITSHCDVSGLFSGKYETQKIADLNNNPPTVINKLKVKGDPGKPVVICKTSTGGQPQTSREATIRLGTGQKDVDGFVEHEYKFNNDKTMLYLTHKNSNTNTTIENVFKKQ